MTALQLQYHYESMQMNGMPKNINLMLFHEVDNFIEVYNSFIERSHAVFWNGLIPTKELGPKTLYLFNNL